MCVCVWNNRVSRATMCVVAVAVSSYLLSNCYFWYLSLKMCQRNRQRFLRHVQRPIPIQRDVIFDANGRLMRVTSSPYLNSRDSFSPRGWRQQDLRRMRSHPISAALFPLHTHGHAACAMCSYKKKRPVTVTKIKMGEKQRRRRHHHRSSLARRRMTKRAGKVQKTIDGTTLFGRCVLSLLSLCHRTEMKMCSTRGNAVRR